MDTSSLRATIVEMLLALTAERDARVTSHADRDLASIEMDDAGAGEFERTITDREASELVRLGVVRDAREYEVLVAYCVEPGCRCDDRAGRVVGSEDEAPTGYEVRRETRVPTSRPNGY